MADDETVYHDFTERLSSEEVKTALMNEINELGRTALSVNTSFHQIELAFDNITHSQTLDLDLDHLKTTWRGYRKKYIDLLWKSREVAGKVQAAATDFAEDFIPFLADATVAIVEKKTEILTYLQKLERDEKTSKVLSDGFRELQESVIAFKDEWKRTVQKYDQAAIGQQISSLDQEIRGIDQMIVDLDKKIDDLAARRRTFLGAICGFFSWLFRAVFGGDSERDKAINERREKISLRVQQLDATLTSVDSDFASICSKLGSFANVWAAIGRDILQIEEKLGWANATGNYKLF
ncbi:hypothetical protein ABKN59_004595 [Abortiporus biennis]